MTLRSRAGSSIRDHKGADLMVSAGLSIPVLVMETNGTPVVSGGDAAGWVSGTIANLAASTAAQCVFDLGPDWDQYQFCQVIVSPVGPSTGLNSVGVFSSDTASLNTSRRLRDAQTSATPFSTTNVSLPTSSGTQAGYFRPAGRYMIVQATNSDATNAQGAAAKVTLAAYPT